MIKADEHVVQFFTFSVEGKPETRGSKSPWIPTDKHGRPKINPRTGKPVIATRDSNVKSAAWMKLVGDVAKIKFGNRPRMKGAIRLTVTFRFQRFSIHYRSGKYSHLLRPDAPMFHRQKPDLSKLMRCMEDALTGVVWDDDAQVCCYGNDSGKVWTHKESGMDVLIEELDLTNQLF